MAKQISGKKEVALSDVIAIYDRVVGKMSDGDAEKDLHAR